MRCVQFRSVIGERQSQGNEAWVDLMQKIECNIAGRSRLMITHGQILKENSDRVLCVVRS